MSTPILSQLSMEKLTGENFLNWKQNINIELIGDNSEFVMIEESQEQALCPHISDGTVNAHDGTVNAWIAPSLHVRDGTVNSWMAPCLHVRDQLNYGLTQLMNELQTFESIMGGPSKGGENKTLMLLLI